MGAPPKIVTIAAERSSTPIEIELWKDVPLQLMIELGQEVEVTGAAFISFEIHTKREFSNSSLLARSEVIPAEASEPYEINFTGRQMNLSIAEGRSSRQLHGVLYARYFPDSDSGDSNEESDTSSDDEDESSGELDILAIVTIDFQRHNASPTSNPDATLPPCISEADAVAMFAPRVAIDDSSGDESSESDQGETRVIMATLSASNDYLEFDYTPGDIVTSVVVQANGYHIGLKYLALDVNQIHFDTVANATYPVAITVYTPPA